MACSAFCGVNANWIIKKTMIEIMKQQSIKTDLILRLIKAVFHKFHLAHSRILCPICFIWQLLIKHNIMNYKHLLPRFRGKIWNIISWYLSDLSSSNSVKSPYFKWICQYWDYGLDNLSWETFRAAKWYYITSHSVLSISLTSSWKSILRKLDLFWKTRK